MKDLAHSGPDTARRYFAALLWTAFPAPSERAVSLIAARVLGYSPRQVVYWLRMECDAPWPVVAAVKRLAGVDPFPPP